MSTVKFGGRTYEVDPLGFLVDFSQWDETYAEGMALALQIPDGLTKEHWDVINFIRDSFKKTGKTPPVYQVCRQNGLDLKELKNLFPTGYQRGACKLAGVTYREGYVERAWFRLPDKKVSPFSGEKTYEVDVRGFLVVPEDWDEQYAAFKAFEMKMPEPLTERHWQIISFLRDHYQKNKVIPTVYETCESNHLIIEELERLFPDGFHRGAVKIAGLRVR